MQIFPHAVFGKKGEAEGFQFCFFFFLPGMWRTRMPGSERGCSRRKRWNSYRQVWTKLDRAIFARLPASYRPRRRIKFVRTHNSNVLVVLCCPSLRALVPFTAPAEEYPRCRIKISVENLQLSKVLFFLSWSKLNTASRQNTQKIIIRTSLFFFFFLSKTKRQCKKFRIISFSSGEQTHKQHIWNENKNIMLIVVVFCLFVWGCYFLVCVWRKKSPGMAVG